MLRGSSGKSQGQIDSSIWIRRFGEETHSVCFATAFRLNDQVDLAAFAKTLPEGVVLCDPKILAGIGHIEEVLLQTKEYWKRNIRIARNGSIEILMRLAGKGQISEALNVSGVTSAKAIALLGLVSDESGAKKLVQNFTSIYKQAAQDIGLLDLSREKARWLKKFHGLPGSLSDKKLQVALQEKSVLLIFSK